MRRSLCLLILVLATCAILAGPAPEPFKSGWHKPIDPDRDCKFIFEGSTLTIELPGTDHDLAPNRGCFNAPRLLRDIEGDFVMQVRISASFRTSDKSVSGGEAPRVAAGLVVIPTEGNCVRLEYGAFRSNGKEMGRAAFRMRGERIYNMELGGWSVPWELKTSRRGERYIYLQLERQGNSISPRISSDGDKWVSSLDVEVPDLPKKLKVGVAAYSLSTGPFKPRFDQFQLVRRRK